MDSGSVAIAVSLGGAVVAGIVRFTRVETRVETLERADTRNEAKLDALVAGVARIEGQLNGAAKAHGG